jgi:hypothetical protein
MANAVELAPCGRSASATFTPAAASHTAGDSVGVAAEFALNGPSGGRLKITAATLQINGATIETTAWRLHLYSSAPTVAYADDAAWDITLGDLTIYLGYVDFSQVLDFGTTLYIDMPNLNKQVKLTGTSVWGILVNGTTLTPQAVAHIVTLHATAL